MMALLDISLDNSATRKDLATTLYDKLFFFMFPAHFDTKFLTPGGTVLKLRNFFYMHVDRKRLKMYKINANCFFFT